MPKLAWPPHTGAPRGGGIGAPAGWWRSSSGSSTSPARTYPWHGNNTNNGGGNGERNAFDAWVHAPGGAANKVQEEYGDRIQNFIENNFRNWFYQIWWNWMRYYYASWFSYEPYWRDYVKQSGNPNPADNRHKNHVHTQAQEGQATRRYERSGREGWSRRGSAREPPVRAAERRRQRVERRHE